MGISLGWAAWYILTSKIPRLLYITHFPNESTICLVGKKIWKTRKKAEGLWINEENVSVYIFIKIECKCGKYYEKVKLKNGNNICVGHIVFEILAKTVFKFLRFILFLALANSS